MFAAAAGEESHSDQHLPAARCKVPHTELLPTCLLACWTLPKFQSRARPTVCPTPGFSRVRSRPPRVLRGQCRNTGPVNVWVRPRRTVSLTDRRELTPRSLILLHYISHCLPKPAARLGRSTLNSPSASHGSTRLDDCGRVLPFCKYSMYVQLPSMLLFPSPFLVTAALNTNYVPPKGQPC